MVFPFYFEITTLNWTRWESVHMITIWDFLKFFQVCFKSKSILCHVPGGEHDNQHVCCGQFYIKNKIKLTFFVLNCESYFVSQLYCQVDEVCCITLVIRKLIHSHIWKSSFHGMTLCLVWSGPKCRETWKTVYEYVRHI